MDTSALDIISIPEIGQSQHRKSVVLLHGWGSNAHNLASLADYLVPQEWQLHCLNGLFPHPHAPDGRMWYDLENPDWHGLTESRDHIRDTMFYLVEQTGIPLENTVLGGFSQGGAMTLEVGLSLPVAALMVLSGYLHPHLTFDAIADPPPQILMIHGRVDQVVPLDCAHQTLQFLEQSPVPLTVSYHEMNTGHEVSLEGLAMMEQFLAALPIQA